MIKYIEGNIFESPAQVIVNTVNTVGVMGKGLAKNFKVYYPEMFHEYQKKCKSKEFEMGKLFLYKTKNKWILNFPTKIHWRNPSKLEYIELGLQKFTEIYSDYGITSIAFPKLGCGNGGLDWNVVKVVMEKYLRPLPIDIYIYLADYNTEKKEFEDIENMEKWLHEDLFSMPYLEFKEEILNKYPGIIYDSMNHSENAKISDEQLSDFWEFLRSGNIIEINNLPFGLQAEKNLLMHILKEIRYIKEVRINNKNGLILLPSITENKKVILFK